MPPVLSDADVGLAPQALSDEDVGLSLSDADVGLAGDARPAPVSEPKTAPIPPTARSENDALRAEMATLRKKDEGSLAAKVLGVAENIVRPFANPVGAVLKIPEQLAAAVGRPTPYTAEAPLVPPSAALKVVEAVTPGGEASVDSPARAAQEFVAEMASGLTSPEMAALMLSGSKAPVPVGRYFQGQMLTQLPASIEAIKEAETGKESTKAVLAAGANIAFPALIEGGIRKGTVAEARAREVGPATAAAVARSEPALEPPKAGPVPPAEPLVPRETALEAPKPEPEPKPIGLGAATPAEFELSPKTATGIKNATVDQERTKRGLPPAMEPARRSFGTVWDSAMAKIDVDPGYTDRLTGELRKQPRALTDVEDATLLHRQIEVQNEYGKATRDLAQAFDDGRMEDVAAEKMRVSALSDQLLDLYNIDKAAGTETGRGLNARKMMAYEDFSLAKMELEKRAAKDGEQLTDVERAEVVRANKEIEETQKRFDEKAARGESEGREAATEAGVAKARSGPKPTETQAEIVAALKERFIAGESDAITSLVQKLARQFVEQGIKERDPLIAAVHDVIKGIDPTLTLRDTMDAISGYGRFKQLSKDEISVKLRDLKGQMQQVAKLEDIESRKPPLKTGVERREPSNEERRLLKLVNEAKRRFGIVVTDPATQLKSALAARKTYYRNQITDLEAQIAAKEKFVKEKTPPPADAELDTLKAKAKALRSEFDAIFGTPGLSDAQRLAAMQKHITALEAKIASGDATAKAAKVNRPLPPELEQAKQRLEGLNKLLAEMRKKPAEQKAADRIARRVEALQKRITEKEAKIAAGDISTKRGAVNRPQVPEIEVAKQRLEALNEQLAELRKAATPKKPAEQVALEALKTRLKKSIETLEDKLSRGDFTKRQPRRIVLDAEAHRLHFEAAKAKAKWHEGLMKDRLARRSLRAKIAGGVSEGINTIRAIMTSGEFSGVLRQGGVIGIANPIRIAKAFPAMFRAFRSEAQQHAVNLEIMARPNYPLYVRSKLFLSEHGQKLSQMEEAYMSRWAGKIPFVAGTQRAYSAFLNKLRADSFDAMAKTLVRRQGELTPERANAISNFINVATGRGNLAAKEGTLTGLNTYFFAPRWVASRFQFIIGQPFMRGDIHTRRLIAEEYGKFLLGTGVIYGLWAMSGNEVETDPRSSDFGKLVVGKTRVDLMAGLQQGTVLLSRLATGETKRLNGKVVSIRGEDVPFGGSDSAEVIGRFLRTKLAPVPASTVDLLSGEDVAGKPATVTSELLELSVPLTYRDIYKAMVDQGVPIGTALSLLAIFGAGVQTYDE